MILIQKDIWTALGTSDAICITTNGFIKNNGCAVMGRGIALETRNKFKGIDLVLGKAMKKNGGNMVNFLIREGKTWIISFPVKRDFLIYDFPVEEKLVKHMKNKFQPGQIVPGWALKAELEIVEMSARILQHTINNHNWWNVYMTQPGCHNGELNWEDVEPILDKYLDERVTCVYK
jgi:hypothetical protein